MGVQNARTIFPETYYKCEQKMFGKKLSEKSAKNVSLYSHEYRYQKMGGGKKRVKQFFQKHKNSAIKKCWGKNRRKKCEEGFFIFTRIT